MAIDTPALSEVVASEAQRANQTRQQGNRQPNNSNAPQALRTGDVRFKKNLFINEHGTGLRVDERGRQKEGFRPQEITLSKELRQQYTNFLDNYVRRLSEIQRQSPAVLQNDNHRVDREILQRLVDERGEPDMKKIEKYLERPEGWMITTQMMEHQTALELYALGMKAFLHPRGERQMGLSENRQISLDWDRGVLHRFIYERLTPGLMRVSNQAGERTDVWYRAARNYNMLAANILGSLTLAGAGALVNPFGAAAGLFPPALTAFLRATRGGVQLYAQHAAGALQTVMSDANEAAFVKTMYGIDVNDFQVNAAGQVEQAPRIGETNDEQAIQMDILEKLYTRFQFYQELGVPRNRLDALPEQFLYDVAPPPLPLTGSLADRRQEPKPEQMRIKWQQRLQEVFDMNHGGIQDGAGNQRELPNPTPPPPFIPNPGYNPPANGMDVQGNIERYMKARRQVMMEMITDMTRWELEKKNAKRPTEEIDEKIKQRRENAEQLRNERGRQYTERRTTLEAVRAQLQTQREPLDAYQQALTTLQNVREEARRAGNATTTTLEGIDVFIQDRNDFINNPARPGSIQARRDALYIERRDWETIQGAALTAPVGSRLRIDQETKISEAADRRFQGRENELNKEEEKIRAQITNLENQRTAVEVQERALEQNQSVVRTVGERFIALQDNYYAITGIDTVLVGAATAAGIPGAAGLAVGLTENDLVTQPLDDLLARINSANAIGAAFPAGSAISIGWPAEQNNRPENRVILLQAIIEARARQIDPSIAALGVELGTFLGQGITENQLRSLTSDQINEFANREFARTGGTLGWTPADNAALAPDMETAAQEAQNRFRVRLNAFDEERRILDEQITQQTEVLTNINFDQEIRQLETTKDVVQREREIIDSMEQISVESGRFTNIAPVPNVATDPAYNNYTQAERATGAARGYYELVNLMFNYRNRADKSAYFERIQAVLSPQKLAEVLNESLGLGLGGAMPLTMENALARMQIRLIGGRFSSLELYPGFRAVIDRLQNEAINLP